MTPTPKTVIIGDEAREKLLAGVNKIAAAVSATLGPAGRNVAIAQYYRESKVTKDGVTVADSIWLADLIENMGAQMVRSAAAKTADDTGDGTSTATVLTQAIFEAGLAAMKMGANPMEMKRGIDAAVAKAIEYINSISIKFDGAEKFDEADGKPNYYLNVATISANGDQEIGNVVSQALQKVGPKGIITIEKTKVPGISFDYTDGYQFDRGWVSPYYVTDPKRMRTEYENAWVLVSTENLFIPSNDIRALLKWVLADEQCESDGKGNFFPRPLIIIAENISGDVFNILLENRVKQLVPWVVVRAPAYADRMEDLAMDIAKYTGATLHSKKTGNDTFSHLMLGTTGKVIVTKSSTILLRGGGLATDDNGQFMAGPELADHIAGLETALADSSNDYEKEVLTERIAKLDGGAVAIKVGAHSEVEAGEKKDRIEDSIQAARAAAEDGIVPGGGIALFRAIKSLDQGDEEYPNDSYAQGIQIVRDILASPLRTIAANCGDDPDTVIKGIMGTTDVPALEVLGDDWGYNGATRNYGNMYEMGIMDPAKVVKCALENAASIATMMITTQVVIADEKMPEGKPSPREGLADLY